LFIHQGFGQLLFLCLLISLFIRLNFTRVLFIRRLIGT
jgi:hypothetical protein